MIEVKSTENYKINSLNKCNEKQKIVLSLQNYSDNNGIKTIPIYLVSHLSNIIDTLTVGGRKRD